MKAAVFDSYGPPEVLRIDEVPRPEPKATQVLVRVRAAGVNSGDARIRASRYPSGFALLSRLVFGFGGPRRGRRILGNTFSGEVVAVGDKVDRIEVGDEVAGSAGISMGTHAEYVVASPTKLALKPEEVNHEQAAGVLFGGLTALCYLRDKAALSPGASVLVNGASGAVGTNVVQLAKHLGAATVTAVCSAANADLVTRLGADKVIDYTTEDLASVSDRFDVVVETVGNLPVAAGRRLLDDGGKLLLVVGSLADSLSPRREVKTGPAPERAADMEILLDLVASGELTVVVDHVYDLGDIAEAHRLVDTGHKVGNVVVRP